MVMIGDGAPSVYVSTAHTAEIINEYLNVADEVFSIIARAIDEESVDQLLETRPRSDAFSRLTT